MSARAPRGVTLIELVVFIAISGIAVAALFGVISTMTARSADPQVRKQLLAIAESLMDEVQLMPFTYCDPDDPNAATATSAVLDAGDTTGAKCMLALEVIGSEDDVSRYSSTKPFDNVSDYHGFTMNPIHDITDQAVSGLGSYNAEVSVAQVALGSTDPVPSTESLRITVTVTGPQGTSLSLEGYRTRYAPNTLP